MPYDETQPRPTIIESGEGQNVRKIYPDKPLNNIAGQPAITTVAGNRGFYRKRTGSNPGEAERIDKGTT